MRLWWWLTFRKLLAKALEFFLRTLPSTYTYNLSRNRETGALGNTSVHCKTANFDSV